MAGGMEWGCDGVSGLRGFGGCGLEAGGVGSGWK